MEKKKMKKHSKYFWIKLASGVTLSAIALTTSLSVMLASRSSYNAYYNDLMSQKSEQERLNSLPLEFLGITVALNDGVAYYKDGFGYAPEKNDFNVKANFTEKGKDFSKKLSSKSFEMTVPEDFAKNGGDILFSYTFTPEKKEEDKTDPVPVTKTATFNYVLQEPSENMYKIETMPTFTEAGSAVNVKGNKITLEPLDKTNYKYEEKFTDGYALFTHIKTGVTIKKAITDSFSVYGKDNVKYEYNNVTCHFANEIENLGISFLDDKFMLSPKTADVLEIGSIEGDDASVELGGNISLTGNIATKKFFVESGAKVVINGTINVDYMCAYKDSDLTCNWSGGDCITINGRGLIELDGKVLMKGNGGGTGINLVGMASLQLTRNSEVKIEDCEWGVGTFWVENEKEDTKEGYLLLPPGYKHDAENDNARYYYGEKCILDASATTQGWLCNIVEKTASEYEIIEAPDLTKQGSAKRTDGSTIVLPALNFTDYEVSIKGKKFVFHHETNLEFEVPFENASNLQIDCVNVNSDESGYTFAVNEGKEASVTGTISSDDLGNITISGKGKMLLNGEINIKEKHSLTVESGSYLKVTAAYNDAINVYDESVLNLFGTVDILGLEGKTSINLHNELSAVYLDETSDVNITGGYSIAHWDTDIYAKVYYPAGFVNEENQIKSSEGKAILTYESTFKVDFVEQTK